MRLCLRTAKHTHLNLTYVDEIGISYRETSVAVRKLEEARRSNLAYMAAFPAGHAKPDILRFYLDERMRAEMENVALERVIAYLKTLLPDKP